MVLNHHMIAVDPFSTPTSGLERRLLRLEEENAQVKKELHHLRRSVSQNNHQDARQDEVQNMLNAFRSQVQDTLQLKHEADALVMENEKQKSAVLFSELVRLGQALESVETQVRTSEDTEHQAFVVSRDLRAQVEQLRQELEQERSDRRRQDHERDQVLASVRTLVSRHETLVNDRMTVQASSSQAAAKLTATEVVRHLMDTSQHDLTSQQLALRQESAVESQRMWDQIASLEHMILSNSSAASKALETTENSLSTLVNDLTSVVSTDFAARHARDVEDQDLVRSRIRDLHDATRDVTSDLQHKVMTLEDTLRMEISARLRAQERLQSGVTSKLESVQHAVNESVREHATHARAHVSSTLESFKATLSEETTNASKVRDIVKECVVAAMARYQTDWQQTWTTFQREWTTTESRTKDQIVDLVAEHAAVKVEFESTLATLERGWIHQLEEVQTQQQDDRKTTSASMTSFADAMQDMCSQWHQESVEEFQAFESDVAQEFVQVHARVQDRMKEVSQRLEQVQHDLHHEELTRVCQETLDSCVHQVEMQDQREKWTRAQDQEARKVAEGVVSGLLSSVERHIVNEQERRWKDRWTQECREIYDRMDTTWNQVYEVQQEAQAGRETLGTLVRTHQHLAQVTSEKHRAHLDDLEIQQVVETLLNHVETQGQAREWTRVSNQLNEALETSQEVQLTCHQVEAQILTLESRWLEYQEKVDGEKTRREQKWQAILMKDVSQKKSDDRNDVQALSLDLTTPITTTLSSPRIRDT